MASWCMRTAIRFRILASGRNIYSACSKHSSIRCLATDSSSSSDSSGTDVESNGEKPKLELAKPTRKRVRGNQESTSVAVDNSDEEQGLDPQLVSAAKSVAEEFPGSESKIESDLLQRLRLHAKTTDEQRDGTPPAKPSFDASNMLSGMRIDGDRGKDASKARSNATQRDGITGVPVTGQLRGKYSQELSARDQYKLFEGKRLDIFNIEKPYTQTMPEPSKESLWDVIQQEEIDKLLDRPPTNAFEEMIQWTKQGKMWHFPIDNEQGWHEEANVPFHEHVFLDKHIKDFPKTGPLRHFMELVAVGLSKNPYMSVQQKVEHISWFREYFSDKMQIIEDSIAHAKAEANS